MGECYVYLARVVTDNANDRNLNINDGAREIKRLCNFHE
jgi:hypothetical protein